MNKYLLSGLCLLALNHAQADGPLTLPTGTITAPAADDERIDLKTPTTAGSRLGLTALETPASTDSLSAEQIRQRGDSSVQDGVSRSAGISRTGNPGDGGTSLQARGFTGQNSVMQLYDGTRMYSGAGTVTFPVDAWSVERVDVLRGPASVLYGEGATGAVINTLPKKPFEGEIENHLRLGYGSYGSQQEALDSGGSLTDNLSYRVNLNRLSSNGWVDRGESSSNFFSGALRWQANDDLVFTLSSDYGDQEPTDYFGSPLINGHYQESLRFKNYNVSDDKLHYNDQWTRLRTDWQISDAISSSNELYYLKAQRRWQNAENYNFDPTTQTLSRASYISIKHEEEQTGDRQTFTFKHSLFGLDSQTLTGVDVNRIRFKLDSTEGVDGLVTLGANAQQFGLSTAKQSEVGLKQMFWDQRGEWTLAAYHIVKKKLLAADPSAPNDPSKQLQVGQQSSDGLEASLDLKLAHDWQLQANASIVRGQAPLPQV